MIRVLLVDDQALFREGLGLILGTQDDIDIVGEADDGNSAIRQARRLVPDVVLMDVRMPGMDGLEATRRILRGGSDLRVLMLTTFDLDAYVYEALRAGASGFLLKSSPRHHLLHAVRTVAEGHALLDPLLTRRLVEQYVSRPPPSADLPEALRALTSRELDVFAELVRGRSNAEIAKTLYLAETTVKTHVARVLQKLNARDRVQAVVLGYECGFAQPGRQRPSPGLA